MSKYINLVPKKFKEIVITNDNLAMFSFLVKLLLEYFIFEAGLLLSWNPLLITNTRNISSRHNKHSIKREMKVPILTFNFSLLNFEYSTQHLWKWQFIVFLIKGLNN